MQSLCAHQHGPSNFNTCQKWAGGMRFPLSGVPTLGSAQADSVRKFFAWSGLVSV